MMMSIRHFPANTGVVPIRPVPVSLEFYLPIFQLADSEITQWLVPKTDPMIIFIKILHVFGHFTILESYFYGMSSRSVKLIG